MSNAVPELRGRGKLRACSAIRICLAPEGDAREYEAAVGRWNKDERPRLQQRDGRQGDATVKHTLMKAVWTQIQPSGGQPCTVCQSVRYVYCNDVRRVRQLCQQDAAYFASQGFEVIGAKIEALTHHINGIPQSRAEAALYPHLYFELCFKIERKETAETADLPVSARLPMTPAEEAELGALAEDLRRDLGVPITLSQMRRADEADFQRMLSARFRGLGLRDIETLRQAIEDAVTAVGAKLLEAPPKYRVLKVIRNYVWHDTADFTG